jgi:hypothetical protein
MIIKQSIQAVEDKHIGFEIAGLDSAAPVPHTGDIIHWTADGKDFTAQVRSKTFTYDKSEVGIARTNDWGVTIRVLVDIVDIVNAPEVPRAATVS